MADTETWTIYADSGEYREQADHALTAAAQFQARHPGDHVAAIVNDGMRPRLVLEDTDVSGTMPVTSPAEVTRALSTWEEAATLAHGGDARSKPLLTAARLIGAGDKLARLLIDELAPLLVDERSADPVASTAPPEVIGALRDRVRWLERAIREADSLSEPCPPDRWRWADVNLSGYGRKSEEELAADRARYQQKAGELRIRLAEVQGYLAGLEKGSDS